jgi:DNA-binding PadR family transcriptional regulator
MILTHNADGSSDSLVKSGPCPWYAAPVSPRQCSELEGFTLGLVWQTGPCSAYDVRVFLARSPSTQWSASAGAIYPVLRRLEKRGWVSARAEKDNARGRRVYKITPSGLAVLRGWVGPPMAHEAVTVTYDPLRSRARFLGCLNPARREQWAAAADDALSTVERNVAEWHERFGGVAGAFEPWITRSGELDCKARRQWLRELKQALAGRKPR